MSVFKGEVEVKIFDFSVTTVIPLGRGTTGMVP
jgi:hypothetical protein